VIRCAKVLERVYEIAPSEALYEATMMATEDALYQTPLATLDEDDNCVKLDLRSTFPSSMQAQGECAQDLKGSFSLTHAIAAPDATWTGTPLNGTASCKCEVTLQVVNHC
jgi:hypothetical protein